MTSTVTGVETNGLLDDLHGRLLTTAALRALPPPEFVIDGLVPLDALTLLYGPSGGCKTFVAVDWALHVATGSWWHGRPVAGGKVLYVVAESPAGVGPRVDAWMTHHGIHDIDAHHGVAWLPMAPNLFDLATAGTFRDLVAHLAPRLVVVDTLARCAVGADENSAKDMGRLVEQLDQVRRSSGAAVVVVHHSGKTLEHGARGSSALRAAVDAEIEVTATDGRVSTKTTKQKNAPEAPPVALTLTPVGQSCVLLPARGDTLDTLGQSTMATFEALQSIAMADGVSSTAWMAVAAVPDRTFWRHRKQLVSAGLVHNIGTDRQPRYVADLQEREDAA